jgi:hypothetical protein
MLRIVDVDGWNLFQERLAEIHQAERSEGRHAEFLYRGHTDFAWNLATTLERAGKEQQRISDYYHAISLAKPQIETFTGTVWDLEVWPKVEELLLREDSFALHQFLGLGTYNYMAHLRHHGFPSPLLDWTRSPYVAAYFAFRSAGRPINDHVAIYAYSEKSGRISDSSMPSIRRVGPYVRTHKRHFLQQSDYTYCATYEYDGWHFGRHDDMFDLEESHQDILWKFKLPWSERIKVLKMLDTYNLNAFSLFDSADSLMETMALRILQFP